MKLLDLFCGAGGGAEGYHRAGFGVVGVDHKNQKNYPCVRRYLRPSKHKEPPGVPPEGSFI